MRAEARAAGEGGREAGLERLNALPAVAAEGELLACCGSREWARRLAAERPFAAAEELAAAADRVWRGLAPADWLEAFRAHPRIGERKAAGGGAAAADPPGAAAAAVEERARRWSGQEQHGAAGAPRDLRERLAAANRAYEARFGHIFIVCASGKSAAEMLALLEARLGNEPAAELAVAAEEQRKITRLRLAKLLQEEHP